MRCVGKDNTLCERMQCGDFIGPPHWLFRADILHGPMQIYCNGCRRYLKRATQYYCYGNWDLFYSRKSRQSRQKLRAIFREIREREIITLVFSSDAARRRPYPLTTHYSLLKAHCSKAVADSRLCRRRMCEERLNTTGSRTRGYSPFRASRPSDATTYI
jgi:hypothetical protein